MQIKIQDITGKASEQMISMQPCEVQVIQTIHEYLNPIAKLTTQPDVFHIEVSAVYFERLTVMEQLKFFKRWYNYPFNILDLVKQFQLENVKNDKINNITREILQRISLVQAIMCDQRYIIALNPFANTSNENIHLFHKTIQQLMDAGKSLLVVATRMEDAFIVQQNILTLNQQGLQAVETDADDINPPELLASKLKVKADDKVIFVNIDEIEYIESSEGKVYIHLNRQQYTLDGTLGATAAHLSVHGFYRCHRSYVVNLHKVKEIITWSKNSYSIVINSLDESKIPLSRTKFSEIQDHLVML